MVKPKRIRVLLAYITKKHTILSHRKTRVRNEMYSDIPGIATND